jgi:hypothetical protein
MKKPEEVLINVTTICAGAAACEVRDTVVEYVPSLTFSG